MHNHLLQKKVNTKCYSNVYDSTSYMNNESIHWERKNNKWIEHINKAQDIQNFDTVIAEKWDKLVGNNKQKVRLDECSTLSGLSRTKTSK